MSRANVEADRIVWEAGATSAVWDYPNAERPPGSGGAGRGPGKAAGRPRSVLVLAHSAGGNLHTPGLAAFAAEMAARGVTAVRFNFLYAEAGRRVPDRRATLEATFRAVAEHVASRAGTERLILGGRSMGGRIASQIVAAGFPARGLLFLGYPLHPPRDPGRLRDAHLPRIGVPMLFFQGSRDPFARPDLLARTLERLPTATLHLVDGGDHGLAVRGRPASEITAELAEAAAAWISRL